MATKAIGGILKAAARAAGAAALVAGTLTAQAAPVSGQGTWETTLQARDLDGNPATTEAWYDTVLDLLWLDMPTPTMTWNDAMTWAAGLTVGTETGWRLPMITDTGTSGCNWSVSGGTDCGYNVDTSGSELAHLWYVTLGNRAYYAPGTGAHEQPGWDLTNTGPFQNLQSSDYWSGTEYETPSTTAAWVFGTNDGWQYFAFKHNSQSVLAVRPGDVAAAVPEPQPVALALLGLAVLWVARRRRPH